MDISNSAVSARTAVVSSASTGYGISTNPEFCFWIGMIHISYGEHDLADGDSFSVYRWTSAVSVSVRRLRTLVSTRFVSLDIFSHNSTMATRKGTGTSRYSNHIFSSFYSTVKFIPARLFSIRSCFTISVTCSALGINHGRKKKGDPINLSFPDGVDGIKGK